MKKLIISALLLGNLAASDKYLGTFTIDNYPIKKCEITKIGSLYSFVSSGYNEQPASLKKRGLLDDIGDNNVRGDLEAKAIKDGYNAILGYKFYINGAFDTFNASTQNGNIGFGIYRVTGQGTPVKIECGKLF